jgi:hypothetical protein
VENFWQIVGAMTREERLAFEQARAQARYEAEHWQEVNMARTKMNEGRLLPAACPNYPATPASAGSSAMSTTASWATPRASIRTT